MLELAADAVERSVFEQPGSGLPETERYAAFDTLPRRSSTHSKNRYALRGPIASATSCSNHGPGHGERSIGPSQRFADDYFVSDRCIPVDRQPVVGPLLVFDRAADRDVRVSRFPVRRQVRFEPVDPFGNREMKVAAFPSLPRFGRKVRLLERKSRN